MMGKSNEYKLNNNQMWGHVLPLWGKKHYWKTGISSSASGELRGDPPRNPALLKSELGFTHLRLENIQTFPAPKGRGILFWVAGVMKVKVRWSGAGALTSMRECCQAPRPAGCSPNRVNMMLATDRVNSFPELHREATQFKHRRLQCSCLHRKWMCVTVARSSVLAETATSDLPLGWWMAC